MDKIFRLECTKSSLEIIMVLQHVIVLHKRISNESMNYNYPWLPDKLAHMYLLILG